MRLYASRFSGPGQSDLFHEKLANEDIDRVFAVMGLASQHCYQILTKRAERMREYITRLSKSIEPLETAARTLGHTFTFHGLDGHRHGLLPWPIPWIWLGVSVEDQATADERIPYLLATPAAVRFVSYEPALGPVNFAGALRPPRCGQCGKDWTFRACGPTHALLATEHTLDWIIVGGESGPNARAFDLAWARSTIAQCRAAGTACFVKQIGSRAVFHPVGFQRSDVDASAPAFQQGNPSLGDNGLRSWPTEHPKGGDPSEWPEDLRMREFPR